MNMFIKTWLTNRINGKNTFNLYLYRRKNNKRAFNNKLYIIKNVFMYLCIDVMNKTN